MEGHQGARESQIRRKAAPVTVLQGVLVKIILVLKRTNVAFFLNILKIAPACNV